MLYITPFKVPYCTKKGAPLKALPHLSWSECKVKWELSQLSISNQGHFAVIPACHDINLIRVPFSWPLLGAFADVSENRPRVKQSGTRYGLFEKVAIRASVWTYGDMSSTQVSPGFTKLTRGNVSVVRVTTVNSFLLLDKCGSVRYYQATLLTTKSTHDVISWEMHSLSK